MNPTFQEKLQLIEKGVAILMEAKSENAITQTAEQLRQRIDTLNDLTPDEKEKGQFGQSIITTIINLTSRIDEQMKESQQDAILAATESLLYDLRKIAKLAPAIGPDVERLRDHFKTHAVKLMKDGDQCVSRASNPQMEKALETRNKLEHAAARLIKTLKKS